MTVSINLPAELEDVLRRRAAATGQNLESFLERVVTESISEETEPPPRKRSKAEFAKRMDAWIAMHPVLDHAIDDSRESFYAGRE